MNAIVYHRYGSPDELAIEEVETPVPKDDQVLVRVKAASVNPLDWHILRGKPYVVRATAGWRTPKRTIPGVDVAGVVEAVGSAVTLFKPGDEVYGEKTRACAEYVCGAEGLFVPKPARLTFEEAAATPVGGATALQALRDKGLLRPGQAVLINGASGGVGTFAVQIAKALGADVTAVCSTANVELVRSLGADRVIDYTREDFTRDARRYDLIVDNAGNRSLLAMRRVMAPDGRLVVVGAPEGNWLAPIARIAGAKLLSRFGRQTFLAHLTDITRDDLLTLSGMIEAGTIRPIIDRCYPLREVPDAIRYLETMRARAKVVITV